MSQLDNEKKIATILTCAVLKKCLTAKKIFKNKQKGQNSNLLTFSFLSLLLVIVWHDNAECIVASDNLWELAIPFF